MKLRRVRRRKRGVGLVFGVVSKVRNALKKIPPQTLRDIGKIAKIALGAGGRSKIIMPRVLALLTRGGTLPHSCTHAEQYDMIYSREARNTSSFAHTVEGVLQGLENRFVLQGLENRFDRIT